MRIGALPAGARALPRSKVGAGARDYLRLAKPRVALLMVFTSLVAAIVAGGDSVAWGRIFLLALAGALACAGSGALNHYLERDGDALMGRTSARPLPSGRVGPGVALAMGLIWLGLGLLLSLQLSPLTAGFVALGALVYVGVYTAWLKRRSPLNIVIGGLAGSFAVLAGWSAVAGLPGTVALLMAFVVFLWTPVHFWAFAIRHREEYAAAGVPMLPVVAGDRAASRWIALHCFWLLAVSLLGFRGTFGAVYLVTAIAAGAGLAAVVTWLNLRPSPRRAQGVFMASNLYLVLLLTGMLVNVLV